MIRFSKYIWLYMIISGLVLVPGTFSFPQRNLAAVIHAYRWIAGRAVRRFLDGLRGRQIHRRGDQFLAAPGRCSADRIGRRAVVLL